MHEVDAKLTVRIFRKDGGQTTVSREVTIDLDRLHDYASDEAAAEAAVGQARAQVQAMLAADALVRQ